MHQHKLKKKHYRRLIGLSLGGTLSLTGMTALPLPCAPPAVAHAATASFAAKAALESQQGEKGTKGEIVSKGERERKGPAIIRNDAINAAPSAKKAQADGKASSPEKPAAGQGSRLANGGKGESLYMNAPGTITIDGAGRGADKFAQVKNMTVTAGHLVIKNFGGKKKPNINNLALNKGMVTMKNGPAICNAIVKGGELDMSSIPTSACNGSKRKDIENVIFSLSISGGEVKTGAQAIGEATIKDGRLYLSQNAQIRDNVNFQRIGSGTLTIDGGYVEGTVRAQKVIMNGGNLFTDAVFSSDNTAYAGRTLSAVQAVFNGGLIGSKNKIPLTLRADCITLGPNFSRDMIAPSDHIAIRPLDKKVIAINNYSRLTLAEAKALVLENQAEINLAKAIISTQNSHGHLSMLVYEPEGVAVEENGKKVIKYFLSPAQIIHTASLKCAPQAAIAHTVQRAFSQMLAADPFQAKLPGAIYLKQAEALAPLGLDYKAMRKALVKAAEAIAAPLFASNNAMRVIDDLTTASVAQRAGQLRSQALRYHSLQGTFSRLESNVWLRIKHGHLSLTNGAYPAGSVKANNYILGYDNRLSDKNYLGAYVALTNGSVQMGREDIKINNSFDYGLYGTAILGEGAYLNYLAHIGTIGNEFRQRTWDAHNWGLSVEYGQRELRHFNLYATPYIQLSYNHIKSDDPHFGGNEINSGSSNALSAKLGIDYSRQDEAGNSYYTGFAYGKTFSRASRTIVNGIAVPNPDQNGNVFYLSFGTDQKISENATFSLDYEKTYGDINGWSVQGKLNWSF